jgi:uncharacterized protein (TIGR02145 family)
MNPRILKLITAIITVLFMVATTAAQKANPEDGVLINGIVWAKYNVDAPGTFAAKPEDAGMFYQWNRNVAWAATGDVTGWDLTFPEGDTWEKANDPSPAGWRVPDFDDIEKLLDTDKVSNEWTTENGVTGRKFTDKATGNSIFLPAVGCRYYDDVTLNLAGEYGIYWSRAAGKDETGVYLLAFYSDSAGWSYSIRLDGVSVRPVAE